MIGDAATAVQMDAGDEADVAAIVAKALELHGHLDVAFANAGISGGMEGIFDNTVENFTSVLRVNLIGPWLMVKHAGKVMADAGQWRLDHLDRQCCRHPLWRWWSALFGIESRRHQPRQSQQRSNLSGTNVRCNAICPGLTETGMTKPTFDYAKEKGVTEKIGRLNPLRRGAQPEELANVALFLSQ